MLIRLNNTLFSHKVTFCFLTETCVVTFYFAYQYENNQIVMLKMLPDISCVCLKQPNHEHVVLKI